MPFHQALRVLIFIPSRACAVIYYDTYPLSSFLPSSLSTPLDISLYISLDLCPDISLFLHLPYHIIPHTIIIITTTTHTHTYTHTHPIYIIYISR